MPSLSNLMEDYRNWRGRQDWEQGKGWQDFFGGDPRAQEQFEKLSGFGTDAGGLVGMIKASHGSPHAFTKFDFSKIGTGEGAQAYGHGGYFAQGFDSPVAGSYRTVDAPLNEKDLLETLAGKKGGNLYNVELKWPNSEMEQNMPLSEENLLHWNKPLSQQSDYVLEKLGMHNKPINLDTAPVGYGPEVKEFEKLLDTKVGGEFIKDVIGKQFYEDLTYSPQAASSFLKSKGIPGIMYYEKYNGPGAKQNQHSYVMFDDALANIVSRNGVSLSDLLQNQQQLKSLNPTGSVFAGYNPTARASLPIGENLTTLSETMGVSPDELITIYRGVPHDVSTINPGDFITTNQQLAKDYAGTGKVISQKVKASDVLDDLNESLGEEYIYRPSLKKLLKK